MGEMIIVSKEDLKSLLTETIESVLEKWGKPSNEERPDSMTLDEALLLLFQHGYPTSKGKIYKLTSTKQMPHRKYGNRLVFSRQEILA